MDADVLMRRETRFILWRPANATTAPHLLIGRYQAGNPPTWVGEQSFPLQLASGFTDLWELPASACGLTDGQVYHYWFEVEDTDPDKNPAARIRIQDPFAFTIDWRLTGPKLPHPPYSGDDERPASVVKYTQGKLVPCDPGGDLAAFGNEPLLNTLPANNRLVIYELPTVWAKLQQEGRLETAVGTFRDVTALIDRAAGGANFSDFDILQPGRSYLTDLGLNALELLPPADSFYRRTWDYGTTNYFAPDSDLGFPEGNASPTANVDLTALIAACHQNGVRFFVDMVMAFGKLDPLQCVDFSGFHFPSPGDHPELRNDPDAWTSGRGDGHKEWRQGFGGTLFRYSTSINQSYDPISGQAASLVPARQFMKAHLTRWMRDFRIDGIRLDSVENVASWDFLQEFKDQARTHWKERWDTQHLGAGADERFLVVGEELSRPLGLLTQGRLDGLWNEAFKGLVRAAIIGRGADGEPNFESTVRKLIDCRNLGFTDGTQAVIYLTSHDVGGFRNERLYNYLVNSGYWDTKKRIKLAFVCLLTAVGIPMILAGDEFADQHDLLDAQGHVSDATKQVDPVNYSRLADPWRKEIFDHVARLIKLRTKHNALSVNDVDFLHIDFNDGKRVLVWRRGSPEGDPVVVVANFSDFATDTSRPNGEYVIPNWPASAPGKQWREVTQDRLVPPEWVGREPIFDWEAKVYVQI